MSEHAGHSMAHDASGGKKSRGVSSQIATIQPKHSNKISIVAPQESAQRIVYLELTWKDMDNAKIILRKLTCNIENKWQEVI